MLRCRCCAYVRGGPGDPVSDAGGGGPVVKRPRAMIQVPWAGPRCFWGMQDLIRKMPGVISTRVGYSGGDVPNATYHHHGTHAEAIEIVFDPNLISYRLLLDF